MNNVFSTLILAGLGIGITAVDADACGRKSRRGNSAPVENYSTAPTAGCCGSNYSSNGTWMGQQQGMYTQNGVTYAPGQQGMYTQNGVTYYTPGQQRTYTQNGVTYAPSQQGMYTQNGVTYYTPGQQGTYTQNGVTYYTPATPPLTMPAANSADMQPATIVVTVPSTDSKIWIDDQPNTQSGTVRTINTPALTPGKEYKYTVKASWSENGKIVENIKKVSVWSGKSTSVDFR